MNNNFTQLALTGKATAFRDLVYNTIHSKLKTALETRKAEVASSLFTNSEE